MYYSSLPTYEMLGKKDPPNTYGDLSSGQGMVYVQSYFDLKIVHSCILRNVVFISQCHQ